MEKEKKPFREGIKEKIKKYAPWVLGASAIVVGIRWALSSTDREDCIVENVACELMASDLICCQQSEEGYSEVQTKKAERASHDVSEHVRNLPHGWNASHKKAETAADHGYNLEPGQTWVESYTTGNKSA